MTTFDPLTEDCTFCNRKAGQQCVDMTGICGREFVAPHTSRVLAARIRAAETEGTPVILYLMSMQVLRDGKWMTPPPDMYKLVRESEGVWISANETFGSRFISPVTGEAEFEDKVKQMGYKIIEKETIYVKK